MRPGFSGESTLSEQIIIVAEHVIYTNVMKHFDLQCTFANRNSAIGILCTDCMVCKGKESLKL